MNWVSVLPPVSSPVDLFDDLPGGQPPSTPRWSGAYPEKGTDRYSVTIVTSKSILGICLLL